MFSFLPVSTRFVNELDRLNGKARDVIRTFDFVAVSIIRAFKPNARIIPAIGKLSIKLECFYYHCIYHWRGSCCYRCHSNLPSRCIQTWTTTIVVLVATSMSNQCQLISPIQNPHFPQPKKSLLLILLLLLSIDFDGGIGIGRSLMHNVFLQSLSTSRVRDFETMICDLLDWPGKAIEICLEMIEYKNTHTLVTNPHSSSLTICNEQLVRLLLLSVDYVWHELCSALTRLQAFTFRCCFWFCRACNKSSVYQSKYCHRQLAHRLDSKHISTAENSIVALPSETGLSSRVIVNGLQLISMLSAN